MNQKKISISLGVTSTAFFHLEETETQASVQRGKYSISRGMYVWWGRSKKKGR
jgi:hypothetical protein